MVTISAGLEEKITRPDEMFDCQMGSIVINGMRIRDSKPHGMLSVADIHCASRATWARSRSRCGSGDDRFYKYIRAFGFGQQTGIELPGETRGLTKPVERWSKVSIGAISMGQEIGISAAATGFADLDDCQRRRPRSAAHRRGDDCAAECSADHRLPARGGHARDFVADRRQMRQMLQGVVLHGTGRKAILEGYSSAGKTGTAQKVDPATGTYSKTKYCRVVCRLRSHQRSADRGGGDS